MNKVFSTLIFLLLSMNCYALEPVDPSGRVFGLENGSYIGDGILESQSMLVPNVKFHSTRVLQEGIISAHTTATFLGFQVAEAHATLKLNTIADGRFDLLDLDASENKAGEGTCDAISCTFKATVMGGLLTLEETWTPKVNGFDLTRGSQLFHGNSALYETSFSLQK